MDTKEDYYLKDGVTILHIKSKMAKETHYFYRGKKIKALCVLCDVIKSPDNYVFDNVYIQMGQNAILEVRRSTKINKMNTNNLYFYVNKLGFVYHFDKLERDVFELMKQENENYKPQ